MKITILGTAYPYRGGIAAFTERLAKAFQKIGDDVNISTFSLQYPDFLFPGKSQYSYSDKPVDLDITSEATYVIRQGTNTGYTIQSDWVAACKGSGGGPQWEFSNTAGKVQPVEFKGWEDLYMYYGKVNPTALTLSVSDFSSIGISVYPNPTESVIYISGKESVDAIRLINISGQLIKEVKNASTLDLSSQRNGLYMIEIESEGSTTTGKLIKR